MFKYLALTLILFVYAATAWTQSQADWAALTKRVEELEKQQEELLLDSHDPSTKVNSFLRNNLTIGGFFEPAFTIVHGEDTHFQATNSSNILGLNLAADYSPKVKFVSQFLTGFTFNYLNQHNDPRAALIGLPKSREFSGINFGAILSQGYLDYRFNEHYSLLSGIGYVPFGFYPQERELVLFIRRSGPQLLRSSNLISALFNGFNFQAHFNRDSSNVGWNAYTINRLEDVKRPGLGLRLWGKKNDNTLQWGLSYQGSKIVQKIENTFGIDLRSAIGKFILTSEYARHIIKGNDVWTYYVEPSYFVYQEEILAYVFFDYADIPTNKTGAGASAVLDPYAKYEYGTGINWLPTSYTRIRAGVTLHNYVEKKLVVTTQERDYVTFDLSAGVAF